MRLLISYVHANRNLVDELALRLESAGHLVWYDKETIGSHPWWQQILYEIEQCEVFLYVLSPVANDSLACRTEVDYALAINKPVLVITARQAKLPDALATTPQIDATHMPVLELMPALNQKLASLREGILTGKFHSPKPVPARPGFPLPPDAVDQFKKRNADLRATSQMEISQMLYELKQVATSGEGEEAKQARAILRQMANSTHLTVGMQQNIQQAIAPAPATNRLWIAVGMVAVVAVMIIAAAVLL